MHKDLCERCHGRGRVLFIRPMFLLLCIAGIALYTWWNWQPGTHYGAILSCSDVIFVLAGIGFILSGGLWVRCPRCWMNLSEAEKRAIRRQEVLQELDVTYRSDGVWRFLLFPFYRSLASQLTESCPDEFPRVSIVLNRHVARHPPVWILFLLHGVVVSQLCVVLLLWWHGAVTGIGGRIALPLLLVETILCVAFYRCVRGIARDVLREYFSDLCDNVCRKCGYSLKGLAGSRCPECGEPISRLGQG